LTESANVELVRSIIDAWERGDYSSAEWAHAEIEFVWADGPDPSVRTGLRGLAQGTREFLSVWQDARAEADDYVELDDERVLVLNRYSGRGKQSGIELARLGARGAFVFYVHGRRVTRLVRYFDGDRALTELGLAGEREAQGP
jgi:ketosteroid isomerase-like protein